MGLLKPCLVLGLLLSALTLRADPEDDVRHAVGELARTSYTWETTVRQRFNGETMEPRLNLNAPVEARGRVEPDGYSEVTLLPSRELAAPVTAISWQGEVVAQTPIGWLRRTEMRETPGQDRMVDFGGKQVRLSRIFKAALEVTARRRPTEELLDLVADLKSYRRVDGLVLAELREQAVEKLWGASQAKRAPEIQGTVIFKFSEAGLEACHLVIAIGFPNRATKKTAWSMQQWSTRFTGVGSTAVEPPAEAVKALAD